MSQAPAHASVPNRPPLGGEGVVDVLAAAVLATPGVTGLHGGRYGETATYLPGRRVVGIRVSTEAVAVHLVVTAASLPGVAAAVRAAVTPHAGSRRVDVTVEDLQEPTPQPEPDSALPVSTHRTAQQGRSSTGLEEQTYD